MADKFDEANLYTLVDEEGVEQTFEMLDAMEVDGKQYFALVPVYDDRISSWRTTANWWS